MFFWLPCVLRARVQQSEISYATPRPSASGLTTNSSALRSVEGFRSLKFSANGGSTFAAVFTNSSGSPLFDLNFFSNQLRTTAPRLVSVILYSSVSMTVISSFCAVTGGAVAEGSAGPAGAGLDAAGAPAGADGRTAA